MTFIGKFYFLKKYCAVIFHVLPIFVYVLGKVYWKMETLFLDIIAKKFPLGVSGTKLMDLNFFPALMYSHCYNSDLQFNTHYSELFSIASLQNSFRGKNIIFNWLIYSSFLDGIDKWTLFEKKKKLSNRIPVSYLFLAFVAFKSAQVEEILTKHLWTRTSVLRTFLNFMQYQVRKTTWHVYKQKSERSTTCTAEREQRSWCLFCWDAVQILSPVLWLNMQIDFAIWEFFFSFYWYYLWSEVMQSG